jgi:hypothetical protein
VLPWRGYFSSFFLLHGVADCARLSYVYRGAGIGTPEAIKLVWSCHREIIADHGPIAADWTTPPPS